MRAYFFCHMYFFLWYVLLLITTSTTTTTTTTISAILSLSVFYLISYLISIRTALYLLSVFYLLRCSLLLYRIFTASGTAIRSLILLSASSRFPLSLSQDYFALFSKSVILPSVSSVVHELSTY